MMALGMFGVPAKGFGDDEKMLACLSGLLTFRTCCEWQTSCVWQKTCFERAAAFSLPLLLKKGGEGRGEEALFINSPSLRLSPRSFLAGRERQNAAGVLRAEHNWSPTRPLWGAVQDAPDRRSTLRSWCQ